jgi:hypothetical protein
MNNAPNPYPIIDKINVKKYDLVLQINSIDQLEKVGWPVEFGEKGKEKYEKLKNENCVIIGVSGNKNRGKSFLLNKISGFEVKSGHLDTTEGISANFPDFRDEEEGKKNIIILDTAGQENPLVREGDNSGSEELNKMQLDDKIREIARDQLVCEYILSEFILEKATVIILVLEQLSYAEQMMLKNITQQLNDKKKKLLVIHNLMNLNTVKEIEGFIENTLLKSLTFKLRRCKMNLFEEKENINNYYYRQLDRENNNLEIFHLIFGNEDEEEIKKYYNDPLIDFIRKFVKTGYAVKFDLIEEFRKFFIDQSLKISDKKLNESTLIYDENKKMISLVGINELQLKGITHDEKGLHNFTGNAMELPYRTYILNENSIYYFCVEIEIYGEIQKEKINIHIDSVKDSFIINIFGTLSDHIDKNAPELIKMDGNLHFGDFCIQISISKTIILNSNKESHFIRDIEKNDDKYDEIYGIYTIKFKMTLLEKKKSTTNKGAIL